MDWRRLKIKMFIELPCLFVNRMNENRACAHDVRCLSDSPRCIFEEALSLTQYFFVFVDR